MDIQPKINPFEESRLIPSEGYLHKVITVESLMRDSFEAVAN